MQRALSVSREKFADWYQAVVREADMAETSPVRGAMVIKPWGWGVWEQIQGELDRRIKATGHENAYFPLFIPLSFIAKEAEHVEGFAKEMAVVTHHRLKNFDGTLKPDPDAELEEPYIIRPTSETIIGDAFSRWIKSHRDLPLLINQWANVMRWEMRTRLFLRTTEFLWQEGHTAHATADEAIAETEQMLEVYADFVENFLALPVVRGRKTPNERFAGALDTYCIEALMQDGKALQAGTSHFLGQNFAKAFDVKFTGKDNKLDYVWATSWGVSTRLIGALIMAHSDDAGLVLPPKLAPIQVVVVPIYKHEEELENISKYVATLKKELVAKGISVKFDNRDTHRPGAKFAEYELKGVPLRVAIGSRDMQNGTVELAGRDTKTKETVAQQGLADHIENLLGDIQQNIYQKAFLFRAENTKEVDTYEEFKRLLDEEPGFLLAHWDGTAETEQRIKEETKATIRCIPLNNKLEAGKCILTGKPSTQRVLFARAY